MKFIARSCVLLCLLFVGVRPSSAEVRLARIFADHMVLQCDQPIQVWGWANSREKVTVKFAGQIVGTTAASDGAWSIQLEPMAASANGISLQVASGDQAVVIQDVVIGEVWHASGQSNMAMTVSAMAKELEQASTDIATADLPTLRICQIKEAESKTPLNDLRNRANWMTCTPANVDRFSGVAFYFAKRLQQELGVPIGIIDTSRGGTPIEPFIPRAAFDSHPTLRRELELGDQEDLEAIWKLPGGVCARSNTWLPGRLFHSRLAPITRFAVRGALWYQGESNCGVGEDPRDYQHKMRALILGWRQALGRENLSMYFVQLPGSGAGEGWPYLREQQRLAADLPHTGMVVTIDLDGAGIHPANKIDVGHRLARWALAKNYGRNIPFSGPMFARQVIQGDKIILHFRHAESGLMVANKDGLAPARETPDAELSHFEVANKSGIWHRATAKIDGVTVVATAAEVKFPLAVRYAYEVSPKDCNLYNRSGLPASPFCSQPKLLNYEPNLPK